MSSFEDLGGRAILEKMSKIFYDDVYQHPWLGKFFADVPQDVIEVQQVDFLQGALGGPMVYCGKLPVPAHKHMYITEELFELRNDILVNALKQVGAKDELIERILRIDNSFRSAIVKESLDQCEKRYNTDTILSFPNPNNKKVA